MVAHWITAAFSCCLLITSVPVQAQPRLWFDGSVDEGSAVLGKLLTDNEDYWGEVVLTGVTYTYEIEPDQPADNRHNRRGTTGRALLNGNQGRGQVGQVGLTGDRPMVVVFDFNRICSFREWQVLSPSGRVAMTLELRDQEETPWQKVFERSYEDSPDQIFHRIPLADLPTGRFARLTIQAPGTTVLREVLAWGDVAAGEESPEVITPTAEGQFPVGIAFPTITGIATTAVSDRESFNWVQSLSADQRQQPAVWTQVSTWDRISDRPLEPTREEINRPIHIVMARNETEAVAVALRNTRVNSARDLQVFLAPLTSEAGEPAENIQARLGVFGVIGDRGFGNNLGPIFEEDNLLGSSLMARYLLNGREIRSFPQVTLPPSGSAVFWLSVTAEHAAPGLYRTTLGIEGGEKLPVTVEVLDVTLPTPFAHVKPYSTNRTHQFPFEYADRAERDIRYGLVSGISDWGRLPDEDRPLLEKLAAEREMRLLCGMGFLVPRRYVDQVYRSAWTGPEDFPEDAADQVREHVRQVVERAQALGLDYDQWYGSTGDEPHARNIGGVAYLCHLIRQADPKVNIYVNPCYWTGYDRGGVADDATVAAGLAEWYVRDVDISMPLFPLLQHRPESWKHFSAPRLVNSYYYVSGHLDRSEDVREIQKYRRMAWDSFRRGFNGWAFYSWYSPRASAWNHFDRNPRGEGLQEPSDYQMVYPGPRGVIPTRHSESLREGWEDWRLLHLLREQKQSEELTELLNDYERGVPPHLLRDRALRLAAASG